VQFQTALLNNASSGLAPNDTAFAVAMFSSKDNQTVFEHYYTPDNALGVPSVTRDSIFRIGSVAKVFTVWTFLAAAGDAFFKDPITKYIPELVNVPASPAVASNVVYDDINDVRWEEVTLGDLASQAAGIPRDGKSILSTMPCQCITVFAHHKVTETFGDLSGMPAEQLAAVGIPQLDQSVLPSCGVNETSVPCTRQGILSQQANNDGRWILTTRQSSSHSCLNSIPYFLRAMHRPIATLPTLSLPTHYRISPAKT
jgi:hypothetical protein